MSGQSKYKPSTAIEKWLDVRLPIIRLGYDSFVEFPSPRNLNYWWTFGGILATMLVMQLVTGIILAMHYTPEATLAFDSVEHIRRDVNWGRIIQGAHATGASMFFVAVYIHIFRGFYFGSYKAPREVVWVLGVMLFLLMMASGFTGYVLPWGQMSFWAATVITNLFAAIPLIGDVTLEWMRGGFVIGNPTLNRFFSLHYLIPFVIAAVVALHIWSFHVPGNGNPTGVEIKSERDTLAFHPYYTMKDLFAIVVFFIPFAWFTFFAPDIMGHPDNYIPADSLVTPPHIVPEWYFMPFYAILRAINFDFLFISSKLGGVIAMFGAILVWFFVPWLDTSKVRSATYRPMLKVAFWLLVISFVGLTYLGAQPAEGAFVMFAQVFTAYYFAYFLIILPLLGFIEKPKPLPDSIAESVLGKTQT